MYFMILRKKKKGNERSSKCVILLITQVTKKRVMSIFKYSTLFVNLNITRIINELRISNSNMTQLVIG